MSATEASTDPIWKQSYADGVPLTLDYGHDTLVDTFTQAVKKYRKRSALSFFGKSTSYGELGEKVLRFAAVLHDKGVRSGDTVAIVLPNSPQNVIAFWATLSLGACAVQHNPQYTTAELTAPFQDHGAKVAVVWNKAADTLDEVAAESDVETIIAVDLIAEMPLSKRIGLALPLPPLRSMRAQLSEKAPGHEDFNTLMDKASVRKGKKVTKAAEVSLTAPALMLYTSGTTGKPKGVPLTHANLSANVQQGIAWVPTLRENIKHVMLAALPMFHAYGLTLNMTLAPFIGGQIVLLPSPTKELLSDALKNHSLTWVPGVPALYNTILDIAESKGYSIDNVRAAFSGAASLPTQVIERWEKTTGSVLIEGYGLSEASPILVINPANTDRRPGYIGLPIPDTEVKFVRTDDPTEEVALGEEGEIIVKGPQVFGGYLNRPEANEPAFVDGWFRTGDVGVMDSDGFIKIVSRVKEMIITGGFNVYPQDVEDVIGELDWVEKVAVVGVPKDDGSEKVVAALVLADGAELDVDALKEHCYSELTRYKVPRDFYAFDSLAEDQLGKIRRVEVRQQVLDEIDES